MPGSFGLSRIGGPLGKLVWAGQAVSGDLSRWTHAFLVLDNDQIIEAEPGGAKIRPVEARLMHKEYLLVDKPVQDYLLDLRMSGASDRDVKGEERELRHYIVDTARRLEGVPYNWLNYPALGLLALGYRPEWLRRFIERSGYMICSQLVDFVYCAQGIHLFNDGRLPMDVTPGDLARYARGEVRDD